MFTALFKIPGKLFFFLIFIYLFIYFWLCWVFVSVRGLSLVAASGGHSSSRCAGLSLSRPLLLRSTGSRRAGSVVVAHGPSWSRGMWDLPRPGLEPVSPALAGRFSTTAPPGKPPENFLKGLLSGKPPGLLCCTFWEEDKPAAGLLGSSCWATASDLSAASSVSFSVIIAPSLRSKYDSAGKGLREGTWHGFSEQQRVLVYYFFATSSLQEVRAWLLSTSA